MNAKITKIQATSRASVKVNDNFYTIEYTEERALPQDIEYNIEEEREDLWNTVNNQCDNQIEDILRTFKK